MPGWCSKNRSAKFKDRTMRTLLPGLMSRKRMTPPNRRIRPRIEPWGRNPARTRALGRPRLKRSPQVNRPRRLNQLPRLNRGRPLTGVLRTCLRLPSHRQSPTPLIPPPLNPSAPVCCFLPKTAGHAICLTAAVPIKTPERFPERGWIAEDASMTDHLNLFSSGHPATTGNKSTRRLMVGRWVRW